MNDKVKTSTLPDGVITEFIGNDSNGNTVKQSNTSNGELLLGKKIGFMFGDTGDQVITLSGGTTFIVTEIIITNASQVVTSTGFTVYDGANHTGNQIFIGTADGFYEALSSLETAADFISMKEYYCISLAKNNRVNFLDRMTCGSSIYASVATIQAPVTCDVYVYGYVMA